MRNFLRTQFTAPLQRMGRGPTLFLCFVALNVMSWTALLGSVMVLHARALGVPTKWVGLLNAILPFAMMTSILTTRMVRRVGSKRMLVSGWTARYIMVMPLVFTPWAYRWWGTQGAAIVLFSGVSMFCLVRALTGISWSSWQHEIVAEEHRGVYFSFESMTARGITIVFGVATFFFFRQDPALWKFSVVSAFGVMMGLASIYFLAQVPGGAPAVVSGETPTPIREEFRTVLHDAQFRPFLFLMIFGTFATMTPPFIVTLYMREHLGMTPGVILLIGAFASVVTMVTVHRWTRIADTHGSPVTMAASGFMTAACLVALGLVGHGRFGLCEITILSILFAVAESGFFVASARSFLHRINPAMRHAYVAVWTTVNSIAGGSSLVLAGVLLDSGSHLAFALTGIGYGVLLAAVCVALLRLPERGINFEEKEYELFDPDQPFVSMLRMYGYVFWPRNNNHENAGNGREH